jgi:hypothetical protein
MGEIGARLGTVVGHMALEGFGDAEFFDMSHDVLSRVVGRRQYCRPR